MQTHDKTCSFLGLTPQTAIGRLINATIIPISSQTPRLLAVARISKSKMGGCGTNSQLGMKRETPTLTFKLKLKIYILMKLVVKAGSRDCESSLKTFYTHHMMLCEWYLDIKVTSPCLPVFLSCAPLNFCHLAWAEMKSLIIVYHHFKDISVKKQRDTDYTEEDFSTLWKDVKALFPALTSSLTITVQHLLLLQQLPEP